MDEKIASAGKNVLADIVKLVQKRGMTGDKGSWIEFLAVYDRKFGHGNGLSDPSKRTVDVLGAFLKTFSEEDDLKFLAKLFQIHSNREVIDKYKKKKSDSDSPEQRLVCFTLEHQHYPLDYSFQSHEEEWVITKLVKKSKSMRSTNMVAVDCEMVLCEDGTDALVKICVVDRNLSVKLSELVNPNKAVADYRTAVTGISANDLTGVTCTLADIQRFMKKLLSRGVILVGHALYNALRALKVDHARVIDTSFIFQYTDGSSYRRPSLNNLCKSVLGYEVGKTGAPHKCLDDARAAMKLVLAKIERGVDTVISVVCEDAPEIEMAKLLLHMIPLYVPSEELTNIIPGDYTIERQAIKKTGGKNYSAFAIFKTLDEADLAFKKVKGDQDKDTGGLPQKLVTFEMSTGEIVTLFVRKMTRDTTSKKRPVETEESSCKSKKELKTEELVEEDEKKLAEANQCREHKEEVAKLKAVLKKKEHEISILHKIIANQTRK